MYLEQAIESCPLIAILGGIRPHEAVAIGKVLIDIGFTCLEVPLNSPDDPLASIYHLSRAFKQQAIIGAGAVTCRDQVVEVAKCGGRLIISPHTDPAIIYRAKEQGLYCIPGFSSATEALLAINAGADALQFFPAASPATLAAIKTILPASMTIFPMDGITLANMSDYRQAGASGFGVGSGLYQPGDPPEKVAKSARIFYEAIRQLS